MSSPHDAYAQGEGRTDANRMDEDAKTGLESGAAQFASTSAGGAVTSAAAESSSSSSSSSAAETEEVRWRRTREADATPELLQSGSATPGLSNSQTLLNPVEASSFAGDAASSSGAASRPPRPAGWASFDDEQARSSSGGYASGPATPASRTLSVDAEDEDVKIAIMALGAMKQLDGSSSSARERADSDAGMQQQHQLDPAGRLRKTYCECRFRSASRSIQC